MWHVLQHMWLQTMLASGNTQVPLAVLTLMNPINVADNVHILMSTSPFVAFTLSREC